jgi:hypothetical protein
MVPTVQSQQKRVEVRGTGGREWNGMSPFPKSAWNEAPSREPHRVGSNTGCMLKAVTKDKNSYVHRHTRALEYMGAKGHPLFFAVKDRLFKEKKPARGGDGS